MSAARVRFRPNTTAARRSIEVEMVISCKLRFDANSEQVGRGDRGGEREERDEQQEHQVQPHEVGVGGLMNRVRLLWAIQTPPMKAKLTK